MKYTEIRNSESKFRRLTGITVVKFKEVFIQLEFLYTKNREKKLKRKKNRVREIGGGRKRKLTLEERFFLLLVFYRTYATNIFLAEIFGIDETTVPRNIKDLEPILAQIFRIPEKKVFLQEDEIRELLYDGSEQEIERPSKKQERFYSGKKKRHTKKFQVVVAKKKPEFFDDGKKKKTRTRIVGFSKVYPGICHDKKMYDQCRVQKPPSLPAFGDSGYQGTNLIIPHKKPRKKELSAEKKEYNRILSSVRVPVEHAIGKMKIWRISGGKLRHSKRNHSLTLKNIAGFHNLMFA